MNTYPMFSIPLGVVQIPDDICEAIKPLSKQYGLVVKQTDPTDEYFVVLNKQKKIKKELTNIFSKWANDIEGLEQTWIMSTSWITDNQNGEPMERHNHKNSVYSGVLYFDDVDESQPPLIFENPVWTINRHMLSAYTFDRNIYNTPEYFAPMQKGLMIFFPSYLHHFHDSFKSKLSRKSLACNFVPTGVIGHADSTIDTNWFAHD